MKGKKGGVDRAGEAGGGVAAVPVRRAAAKRARAVMVVGPTARQSKWLPMVLGARDEGAALGPWMRERGHTQPEIDAAYALQARMKAKGRELEAENVKPLLLGVRAEIVDRVKRRVGIGAAKFAADVDTLRAIDAALRQMANWARQDERAGITPPPAAAGGASVRGARIGARGARGGGKAAMEGAVGAINGVEVGGGAVDCAVEASAGVVEALGGGIGEGGGDEGGVLLSVPLAGC